ncbi:hypothetical protein E2562_012250, partial [Oryza meyeriana var. granulata]
MVPRFEPAPVQVVLTEEISGSLRKLKGCCNLARDRYKSIEKRGILAPSKKIRLQLWDLNMDSGLVSTFQVHEHLRLKHRSDHFGSKQKPNE